MRIATGADHRGAGIAEQIAAWIEAQGHTLVPTPMACADRACDYPDMAYPAASAVSRGKADRGILVCGSGIGMSIAANKVKGVRAALVHDEVGAELSRRHNDANIICLAADLLSARQLERILEVWLNTEFEGGRHARRVAKLAAIEDGRNPTDVVDDEYAVTE